MRRVAPGLETSEQIKEYMTTYDRRAFIGTGLATAASLAVAMSTRAADTPSTDSHAELRRLIDEQRRVIADNLKTGEFTGAAVCLIYGGQSIWVEGFGVTDEPSGRKVGAPQSTADHWAAFCVFGS